MRLNDVALAFPQILLALLVLTAVDQPAWWMIVLLVGASHAPRVARLARGVALGIVSRDYVTAAEALGESRLRVILAEVLPNMNAPLLAEAGLRLTYSIGIVAGVGFLGFATNPGAADWGLMIYENRLALLVQPWGDAGAGDHHRCLHRRHQPDGRRHRAARRHGVTDMTLLEKDTPDVEAGCTVSDLRVALTGRDLDVVDEINIELRPGEVVGLVGESGSGKTTAGTALLAYARRGAFIERGTVMFEGQDVLALPWEQIREIRGMKIAYVPQDPGAALNPAIRIGRQIVELLELHDIGTAEERLEGARDGLREVGLPDDDEFLARYPHQLSGGQVQRVALAMAFLPRPKVLVLDEPTTGLDVTTQGMVLQTMGELCRSHRVAALYVTHDLAVVANIADRVAVMYAGQIIELGPRDAMFRQPAHPYTRALLDAIPHLSPGPRAHRHPGLDAGAGAAPDRAAGSTPAASTSRTAAGRSSRRTSRSARTTRRSACASARSAPGTSTAATPPTPTRTPPGTSS